MFRGAWLTSLQDLKQEELAGPVFSRLEKCGGLGGCQSPLETLRCIFSELSKAPLFCLSSLQLCGTKLVVGSAALTLLKWCYWHFHAFIVLAYSTLATLHTFGNEATILSVRYPQDHGLAVSPDPPPHQTLHKALFLPVHGYCLQKLFLLFVRVCISKITRVFRKEASWEKCPRWVYAFHRCMFPPTRTGPRGCKAQCNNILCPFNPSWEATKSARADMSSSAFSWHLLNRQNFWLLPHF